jgi:hypothetical protein
MMSAPGNQQYNHLCTQIDDSTTTLAFASTIDFSSENAVAPTSIEESSEPPCTKHEEIKQHPLLINFDDELDAADYQPTFNGNLQEYMHWHYHLNHASFTTMYNMARLKTKPTANHPYAMTAQVQMHAENSGNKSQQITIPHGNLYYNQETLSPWTSS